MVELVRILHITENRLGPRFTYFPLVPCSTAMYNIHKYNMHTFGITLYSVQSSHLMPWDKPQKPIWEIRNTREYSPSYEKIETNLCYKVALICVQCTNTEIDRQPTSTFSPFVVQDEDPSLSFTLTFYFVYWDWKSRFPRGTFHFKSECTDRGST